MHITVASPISSKLHVEDIYSGHTVVDGEYYKRLLLLKRHPVKSGPFSSSRIIR